MSFPIKQQALLRQGRCPMVWSVAFPDPALASGVREDDARGLVANVAVGGGAVRNDFDRIPIFRRPIFNATWNPTRRKWHSFVPQGAIGFTWSPAASYREVVYRCQPFWYKLDMSGDAAPMKISVAAKPLEGYTLAPMFQNGQTPVYRPVFEMGVGTDGLPHSRAGLIPYRAKPADLMAAARRYGTIARLESVKDWFSDMLLMLVEFATWSPGTLMSGNTGVDLLKTGTALSEVTASSGTPAAGSACVWRGKENPWRNACSCLCDVLIRSSDAAAGVTTEVCYLPNISKFTGAITADYKTVGAYALQQNGYTGVGGFVMGEGFLYPKNAVTDGVAAKGYACLNVPNGSDSPIAVGVGGSSAQGLLPTNLLPSPFHWEGVQLDDSSSDYLGARLVLNEGF